MFRIRKIIRTSVLIFISFLSLVQISFAQSGSFRDVNSSPNIISETARIGTAVSGLDIRLSRGGREINPGGSEVRTLRVIDSFHPDPALAVKLESGNRITIVTTKALDFEQVTEYSLFMSVSFNGGGGGSISFTVSVTDVPLDTITLSDTNKGINSINESATGSTRISNILLEVRDDKNEVVMTDDIAWQITGADSRLFRVNTNGSMALANGQSLDYETSESYTLTVTASVTGPAGRVSAQEVVDINIINAFEDITIQDTDNSDNTILENTPPGTVVSNIEWEVRDEGDTLIPEADVTWSLLGSASGLFTINQASGEISLVRNELDFETRQSYVLTAQATASKLGAEVTKSVDVTVSVIDVASGSMIDDIDTSANLIGDSASVNTLVLGINLQLRNINSDEVFEKVSWSLVDTETDQIFAIDPVSGDISLALEGEVDYSVQNHYMLTVQAQGFIDDGGTLVLEPEVTRSEIRIEVFNSISLTRVNPFTPQIRETESSGTVIGGTPIVIRTNADAVNFLDGLTISATDDVNWSLEDPEGSGLFVINPRTGVLLRSNIGTLDPILYRVIIEAEVHGLRTRFTQFFVQIVNAVENISIIDLDTTSDTIIYEGENTIQGLTLSVVDEDNVAVFVEDTVLNIEWAILDSPSNPSNGLFQIDQSDGTLSLTPSVVLDFDESPTEYMLTIQAEVATLDLRLIAQKIVTINVLNVLESITLIEANSGTTGDVTVTIPESLSPSDPLPNIKLELRDEANKILTRGVTWSLTSSASDLFEISSTNGVISLSPTGRLDYEMVMNHSISISAIARLRDVAISAQITINVNVSNVLESIVLRELDTSDNVILESLPAGSIISNIELEVRDERDVLVPNSEIIWNLLDSAGGTFTISSMTGAISLASTATLDYESIQSYNLLIQAKASVEGVMPTTLSTTINIGNVLDSIVIQDVNSSTNTIFENAVTNTEISGVVLEVRDESNVLVSNDDITWSLLDSAGGTFMISSISGAISLSSTATLDHESIPTYNLVIQAEALVEGVTEQTELLIAIDVLNTLETIDIQDIDSRANMIFDNALAGALVSNIALEVRDERNVLIPITAITWSLINSAGDSFIINSTSGVISLSPTAILDYENTPSYNLIIQAEALVEGVTAQTTLPLAIDIINALEYIVIRDADDSANTIFENASPNTEISGITLEVLFGSDELISNDVITWSLLDSAGEVFTISSMSGAISLGSSTETLDYENILSYNLTVRAEAFVENVIVQATESITITVINILESIVVQDVNDSPNIIYDNATTESEILGITLEVLDEGNRPVSNDNITWSLMPTTATHPFKISSTSGAISLSLDESLDYVTTPSFNLVIQAEALVEGVTARATLPIVIDVLDALLNVVILDVNDSPNEISEDASSGTLVTNIVLEVRFGSDILVSSNNITWSLPNLSNDTFVISTMSGEIFLSSTAELDHELIPLYELVIQAEISVEGETARKTEIIPIEVLNILENVVIRDVNDSANTVFENASPNTEILGIVLEVRDERDALVPNDDITWSLLDSAEDAFLISSMSGEISLSPIGILDYESTPSYNVVIHIEALMGGVIAQATLPIVIDILDSLESITVQDANDSANTIYDNALPGTLVPNITLEVRDENNALVSNDDITWSLLDSAGSTFIISSMSGAISLGSSTETLDYVITPSYNLVIQAEALVEGVTRQATLSIVVGITNALERIFVQDANDSANTILENALPGAVLSNIALEVRYGSNVLVSNDDTTWSFLNTANDTFIISSTSGEISLSSTASSLDYETTPSYSLVVQAETLVEGLIRQATLPIEISVLNVLESIVIQDTNRTPSTIYDNTPPGTLIPDIMLEVRDENNELIPNDNITWSLSNPTTDTFTISSMTGAISLSSTASSLDYEITPTYDLTVQAEALVEGVMAQAVLPITINILDSLERIVIRDINDSTSEISENALPGTVVPNITLEVIYGSNVLVPNDDITWILLDSIEDTFTISSTNSEISLLPAAVLDYESSPSHTLLIQAEVTVKSGTARARTPLEIEINVRNVLESIAIQDTNTDENIIYDNATSLSEVLNIILEVSDERDALVSNDDITWSLQDSAGDIFEISSMTGEISLLNETRLDRDDIPSYNLVIQAEAVVEGITASATLPIEIVVRNARERVFIQDTNELPNTILENASSQTLVSNIALEVRYGSDQLLPADTIEWYFIDSAGGTFMISATSGEISLKPSTITPATLDYETTPSYTLVANITTIIDGLYHADASLTLDVNVLNILEDIVIQDVNDSANTISENASPNTEISGITLEVLDERNELLPNTAITWSLLNSTEDIFIISSMTGAISLASSTATLDYESRPSHTLTIQAEALVEGLTAQAVLPITIDILNALEDIAIQDTDDSANTIYDNALSGTLVPNITLEVLDENNAMVSNDDITWSLLDSAGSTFIISSATGAISLGSSTETLDYAMTPSYDLVIQAEALVEGVTARATLPIVIDIINSLERVVVQDANDSANQISENASSGTMVSNIALEVRYGSNILIPNDDITWSLLDSAGNIFIISSTTGAISLSPNDTLDYEITPSYDLTVQAEALVEGATVQATPLTIKIDVLDVLESIVVQDIDDSTNALPEDVTTTTMVSGITLQAMDENSRVLSNSQNNLMWAFAPDGNPNDLFSINVETGSLRWNSSATEASNNLPPSEQFFRVSVIATALNERNEMIQSQPLELTIEIQLGAIRLRTRLFLEGPLQ